MYVNYIPVKLIKKTYVYNAMILEKIAGLEYAEGFGVGSSHEVVVTKQKETRPGRCCSQ